MGKYDMFCASSDNAKRVYPIESNPIMTEFQIDRDKILYSKEFRRLSGKTQVFVTGFDDNMRTRLTHTLEVAQVADTIVRYIGLNEILTQAIAFGHDVGHTPFGHVGERTLNHIMNGCEDYYDFNTNLSIEQMGFKHNLQSIRVVTELERQAQNYKGLNLTNYTLWGILNHSSIDPKKCDYYNDTTQICRYKNQNSKCSRHSTPSFGFYNFQNIINDITDWTFEACVVATADEIAQRNHDTEDGLYAGIIDIANLCEKFEEIFYKFLTENEIQELRKIGKINLDKEPRMSKLVLNFYVSNYMKQLSQQLQYIKDKYNINDQAAFLKMRKQIFDYEGPIIEKFSFAPDFKKCDEQFQKYLSQIVLNSEIAQSMDGKSAYIIKRLVKAYLTNPQQLPDETIIQIINEYSDTPAEKDKLSSISKAVIASDARNNIRDAINKDVAKIRVILLRKVCDHIAGMTDQYALQQYNKLYGTKPMRNFF